MEHEEHNCVYSFKSAPQVHLGRSRPVNRSKQWFTRPPNFPGRLRKALRLLVKSSSDTGKYLGRILVQGELYRQVFYRDTLVECSLAVLTCGHILLMWALFNLEVEHAGCPCCLTGNMKLPISDAVKVDLLQAGFCNIQDLFTPGLGLIKRTLARLDIKSCQAQGFKSKKTILTLYEIKFQQKLTVC